MQNNENYGNIQTLDFEIQRLFKEISRYDQGQINEDTVKKLLKRHHTLCIKRKRLVRKMKGEV